MNRIFRFFSFSAFLIMILASPLYDRSFARGLSDSASKKTKEAVIDSVPAESPLCNLENGTEGFSDAHIKLTEIKSFFCTPSSFSIKKLNSYSQIRIKKINFNFYKDKFKTSINTFKTLF